MSAADLESPPAAADLFLASEADEVEESRPTLTGDVFADVQIPGLDSPGLAIILTHPCSMRRDGVNLAERLLMAEVRMYQNVPLTGWATGHYRVMPLPQLGGEVGYAASFDNIGLVRSDELAGHQRVACLTPLGINLLQQRLIWHLTRFAVPTFKLNESCSAVFEEAELCEEWAIQRVSQGFTIGQANAEFHAWIRGVDASDQMRQQGLADPQRRAGIRRAMREALKTI